MVTTATLFRGGANVRSEGNVSRAGKSNIAVVEVFADVREQLADNPH